MLQRKKSEGFNLAFLDIMSCGLGAIILVFMLVKHKVEDASGELENLKNDIQHLEQTKEESLQALQRLEAQVSENTLDKETAQRKYNELQSALANKSADVEKTSQAIAKLKTEIKDIKVEKKEDLIEIEKSNEENYLLGLKVEGKRIALLVDSSASMTNEKLIDIIKTKNSSKSDKRQASKWQRTKSIVAWLLARLPKDSDVVVITFNETTIALGKQSWVKSDEASALPAILKDLNATIPQGGTNLQSGLEAVKKLKPTNLYLITDGLPTKGESRYKSLNPFASCSSLLGRSNNISGECRVKLFQQTVIESTPSSAQIDVILLPVEGDPDAVNQYWSWAATTGGLVISPAGNWP